MAISIISVKEKKGNYQGKDYHNFNIFGINPETTNPQVVAGAEVEEMKVKADAFVAILNRNIGALNTPDVKQVKDIIGLYISPSYDKFGNVADFMLAVPEKKKG